MDSTENIIQKKVAALPQSPGVYQFFDAKGVLLYIGKATHLKSRVGSYFRASTDLSDAKRLMVSRIVDIQITVVDTPAEALLLETTLIKKHKPPFNVVMKDDKNFQYIHISDDPFPRIDTTRQIPFGVSRKGLFFGPYTSGRAVGATLKLLKDIFHYCTTPPVQKRGETHYPSRPCLDFHLGKCVGPCARAISQEAYARIIDHIAHFLEGEYNTIRSQIAREMEQASQTQQFERAAQLRDQVAAIDSMMVEQKVISTKGDNGDYLSLARDGAHAAINLFIVRRGVLVQQQVYVLQHTKDQNDTEVIDAFREQYYAQVQTLPKKIYTTAEVRKGKHRKMLEMGVLNAEQALHKDRIQRERQEKQTQTGMAAFATALGMTPDALQRIEIYDISNFQGAHSVGSMVVFEKGMPAPQHYRQFRIRTVDGPNDFASLKEVLRRRLMHLPEKHRGKRQEWPRPDLIIIDGGKGQLSSVVSVLAMLSLDIPIISLAKREEEIFLPHTKDPIVLEKESPGYHFVQRMRDEAHRFAIGFYRKRHLKSLIQTTE